MDLQEFIKVLENFPEELMQEFAELIREPIANIIDNAIKQFYEDWDKGQYARTEEFKKYAFNHEDFLTYQDGVAKIHFDGSDIPNHPSWSGKKSISGADLFDDAYMNGMHGYGKWHMTTTTSPDSIVAQQINEFNMTNYLIQAADTVIRRYL